jgi:VWFA-related protein
MLARTGAAAFSVLAFAAFPLSVAAQTPPPGKVVAETSAVTAIEIPVNVVGRDGKPVGNLKKEDFELFDENKRQEISAVDLVDLRGTPAADTPPSARRHWLIVLDLTYTSPKGLTLARAAARDFIDHATTDTDLVGVATLSVDSGWKLLANFSRDRPALERAVAAAGTEANTTSADPLSFSIQVPGAELDAGQGNFNKKPEMRENALETQRALDKGNDARERGRVAQLVGNLSGVARTLDSVRGRKHVLFFSEGFDARLLLGSDRLRTTNGQEQPAPLANDESASEQALHGRTWNVDSDSRFGSSATRTQFSGALGAFRRSDTVLHSVDVTGLQSQSVDASNLKARSGRDALFMMAHETDGELVQNSNELSSELQKVADRTSLVYVLVYQPKGLQKPGAYHSLRVAVKTPGARVSARAGYYEPRPFARLSPLERLLATGDLLTGGGGNALGLTLLAAPFPSGAGTAQVPVILELPGPQLLAGASGAQEPVEIYAYAVDTGGTLRDYATQEFTLDLTKLRATLAGGGIKYYATLNLPPGDFTIRVLARNPETGRVGHASLALKVPAAPGGPAFVLPPLFQAGPSSWIFVKKPPAPGQPSPEYPFVIGADTFVPAAAPVLDPEKESRIALVTYNFPGGAAPPPLDLRVEVADAAGKVWPAAVRALGQTQGEKDAPRKLLIGFRPDGLPDGKYRMKISVAERVSGAAADASAGFEVRKSGAAPAAPGPAKN